jgi:hypothetical protein
MSTGMEVRTQMNMSAWDRLFRLIIALGIAVLFLTKILTGTWAIVLGILAVIFFVTAVIGLCPLYAPFKFSTRKKARTS